MMPHDSGPVGLPERLRSPPSHRATQDSRRGLAQETADSTVEVAVLSITKCSTALSCYAAKGAAGQTVALRCILVGGGARLFGRTLAFHVDGRYAGAAVTGADGVASLPYAIPGTAPGGAHNVTAAFDGSADSTYASTSRTAAVLTVKPATIISFYAAAGSAGQTVSRRCILLSGSTRLAGRPVAFSVGATTAGTGTTDASGVASVSYRIPVGLVPGVYEVTGAFAGDSAYAPTTRTAAVLTVR